MARLPFKVEGMSFRIGVIGTGHIGRLHSRILAEVAGKDFVCVYDTNAQAARDVAQLHGGGVAGGGVALCDIVRIALYFSSL